MNSFQLRVGDVRVDLGGGNIGMAKEPLDASDVGAIDEQIGGKAMAQGVGRNVFGDAGGGGVALHESLDAANGEAGVFTAARVILYARVVDEEGFAGVVSGFEVFIHPIGGLGADENRTVLLALTANHKFTPVEVDVADIKVYQLADAQAPAEEELYDGAVPEAHRI